MLKIKVDTPEMMLMAQLRSRLPLASLLVGAGVMPAVLLYGTGTHMVMFVPVFHMIVVGATGALAATAAITMSIIAARRNDGHALWLGLAFSVTATLLVIHGLSTPGSSCPPTASCRLPAR